MTSVSLRASQRSSLLYSIVASWFLWPAEAWTQSTAAIRDLPPVTVSSAPSAASKQKPNSTGNAQSTRVRRQRAAAAAAPAAAGSQLSPTLNLNQPASSGSRLNLTRLQTPASVEVITAETIAERGQ